MIIITIIFASLFWQEIACFWLYVEYKGDVEPTPEWKEEYQEKFEEIGAANISMSAAHILHSLTVEDAKIFFNIDMPNNNGIPAGNPDLTADDSRAVLANVPSRPSGYSSAGLHGFVDFMDHATNLDWTLRNNRLERLLHKFHMHETWAIARKAAGDFSGVSEDICIGALDHANNGIDKSIAIAFKFFKYEDGKPGTKPNKTLTWDDNGESWNLWKANLPSISSGTIKTMGLYAHCLMNKFPPSEKPIPVCCDSKTVGKFSYTKVSTGEVPSQCLNNCIYSRVGESGSRYCFGPGKEMVQCQAWQG